MLVGLRSIATALLLSTAVACGAGSTSEDLEESGGQALTQNPDVQSPAEIAAAKARVARDFASAKSLAAPTPRELKAIDAKYAYLDPNHQVPADLLQTATRYFDQNKASFPNQAFISIVDYKPRSDAYRFFLVDMATGAVERYHTTHGTGSDTDDDGYAESFGNVEGSGKSSLGFVRTAEVYSGTYHVAVRLDGLSTTNSNMRERAVVFHGWDEVHEANVKQGLSWGCITLDWAVKDGVLQKIKEGSLLYGGVSGSGN